MNQARIDLLREMIKRRQTAASVASDHYAKANLRSYLDDMRSLDAECIELQRDIEELEGGK